MKQLLTASIALMMVFIHFSCSGQPQQKPDISSSEVKSQVGLYYFHFERRCSTCISVEENSKKAFGELFPEQVKTGEYFFKGVNLDEKSSAEIADELGVGMQTLMVVHGDTKIDITSEGFMYAHDYDKLKEEIKNAVEKALKG
jgi:hypothetical protein